MNNKRNFPTGRQLLLGGTALAGLAVVLALLLGLYAGRVYRARLEQKDRFLNYAQSFLRLQNQQVEQVRSSHRQHLLDQMRLVESIYQRRDVSGILSDAEEAAALQALEDASFSPFLYMVDGQGEVLLASDPSLIGLSLAQLGILSPEQLAELASGGFDAIAVQPGAGWRGELLSSLPGQWEGEAFDLYFIAHNCTALNETRYLVFCEPASMLEKEEAATRDLDAVESLRRDGQSLSFLVDLNSRTFLRFRQKGQTLDGAPCAAYGIDTGALAEEREQTARLGGKNYRLFSRVAPGEIAVVYAVRQGLPLRQLMLNGVGSSLLILILMAVMGIAYALRLRQRYLPGCPKTINPEVLRRTGAFFLCGILLFAAVTVYSSTYSGIEQAMEDVDDAMDSFAADYRALKASTEVIDAYYTGQVHSLARLIALWAEENADSLFNGASGSEDDVHAYTTVHPGEDLLYPAIDRDGSPILSQAHHPELARFAHSYELDDLFFLNQDGYTIATNSPYWYYSINWEDEDDYTHPFAEVLQGRQPYYYVEETDPEASRTAAVPFRYYISRTDSGEKRYLSRREYLLRKDSPQPGETLSRENGLCVAYLEGVSPATRDRNLWLSDRLLDLGADTGDTLTLYTAADETSLLADFGLPETALGGSYNCFMDRKTNAPALFGGTFVGLRYDPEQGLYLVAARKGSAVFAERSYVPGALALVSLYLAFITVLLSLSPGAHRLKGDEIFSPPPLPLRRPGAALRWGDMTPDEKLGRTVRLAAVCAIAGQLAVILAQLLGIEQPSMLAYLFSNRCPRGLNIFSVSYCVLLMGCIVGTTWLLRTAMERVSRVLNRQLETYVRLFISVVEYLLLISGVMRSLYRFGMDTSGIFTSATVLAAVVGFGAQKMVADIMMGVFIVFDGDFRVGDYVQVNNFTGIVRQIGQRNTKIANVDGSVLTIANSSISNLINLSDETSSVYMTLSFERSNRPEDLQRIIDARLNEGLAGNLHFLEVPYYLGIVSMDTSRYTIAITGKCLQNEKSRAQRELNRVLVGIIEEINNGQK